MSKKNGKNRVGFLLDETGSMQVRRDETIVAVNNYLATLRKEKARVTFATFDTAQGVNFRHVDVRAKDINDLDKATYSPNQMTPLHDAVGKMIGEMEQHANSGDKVLIVIVTDGQENASQEFDLPKVQALIKKQEAAGWAFAYIGATAEAWAGGASLGVAVGAILNVGGHQMVGAMRAQCTATSEYFAGNVTAQNLYAHSRHLVEDDEEIDA